MELSEIHDCEKCHNKIVMITTINGQTCCGYCRQPVNYKPYFDELKKRREIAVSTGESE